MIYGLPTTINFGDVEFRIGGDGDYRVILDIFSVLDDNTLDKTERILAALCIFYDMEDLNDLSQLPDLQEAVEKMFWFFSAGRPEGKSSKSYKLVDWDKDYSMICAAVNNVAHKEIRSEQYIHWWTFMGYYMSVGESVMSTVMSIRDKMMRGKKLEKWERQYRNENHEYFVWETKSAEERDFEKALAEIWNGGEK